MNASVTDAVQALGVTVAGLLPAVTSPELTPDVIINPVKTHPVGIGGYVGLHPSPLGEIHARRLQAQVVIRVKADSLADLGGSESAVTNALVGANRTFLRSQGIHRLSRDTEFSQLYLGAEDGLAVAAGKDIRFDIDYEFRQLPEIAGGQISALPLDLMLHTTSGKPAPLFDHSFGTDPLSSFDVFDDAPTNNGPGVWSYSSADQRVNQTSSIRGGSNAFNPSKRGGYLVLQPATVPALPENWLLKVELGADQGGIGLVFNFEDINNYYFFLMNLPSAYRILGKKVGGALSFLDSGGQDSGNSYGAGEHHLRLLQQNGELQLALDHKPVMSAREHTLPAAGRVGFFCRNCPTARFRSLRWLSL
jgi:hypothetical protein